MRARRFAAFLSASTFGVFAFFAALALAAASVAHADERFTLSWDEIARSSQTMGEHNTLPMELQALTTTVTNPDIYALGTSTTAVSFAVIAMALFAIAILRARQARHGSDAG